MDGSHDQLLTASENYSESQAKLQRMQSKVDEMRQRRDDAVRKNCDAEVVLSNLKADVSALEFKIDTIKEQ